MKSWKAVRSSGLICVLILACSPSIADSPRPVQADVLVVIDNAGKEHPLKTWKFSAGIRRLSWLIPADSAKKDKDASGGDKPKGEEGPEALEFREDNSTNLAKGILTFVPLDRVRAIDYDLEAQTVTVHVATGEKADADEELTGTTKYQGENKLTIEAEVDKGDLGVAEVKFQGGGAHGIRGIRFPAPKPAASAPAGRAALITATDKDKTTYPVTDLQALYRLDDGTLQPLSTLMFKKTLKLDLSSLKKIHLADKNAGEGEEYEVTTKDGEVNTLTLLPSIPKEDKTATLEGLWGRVKVGYKLFPLPAIEEVLFDEGKAESK